MKHFSRTLLLLVGLVVAVNAFAIHENKKEGEDFDFEFDEFAGEASSSAASSNDSSSSEEDGELEAHAEMLPANFENVEPPGVDHMELTSDVVPAKMMREYEGRMVEV